MELTGLTAHLRFRDVCGQAVRVPGLAKVQFALDATERPTKLKIKTLHTHNSTAGILMQSKCLERWAGRNIKFIVCPKTKKQPAAGILT